MTDFIDKRAPRIRDPRLDFFRGLGMFIILIAHVPWNGWTEWIPARFGFSDAADMFIFCSGAASALAFAPIFDKRGWYLGTVRIVYRVWQIYWAHIAVFFMTFSFVIWADLKLGGNHYVGAELNLTSFFEFPRERILGLMTLTFIPNNFDILPMYLVILCMIPMIMFLARIHRFAAFGMIIALWLAANVWGIKLTADMIEHRLWFFNPFGWQLLFFTSFAFVRGWLPVPKPNAWLISASVILIVMSAPVACQTEFNCYAGYGKFPVLGEIHQQLDPLIHKMDLGLLRYLHFLATAYLAYIACGPHGMYLRGRLVETICGVGQQTLAVFLTGTVASLVMGLALDILGRNFYAELIVNLSGFGVLIMSAAIVRYFKALPWRPKIQKAHD